MPLDSLQNGRYQTVRELGHGSMGEVFLVQDTVIGRQVAIKTMRADPASYPDTESIKDAVRLFKREAQAIARLEHPSILPLFDFGEEKSEKMVFTYMVMPYCHEGSLADWLKHNRPGKMLPLDELLYFIEQAAEALLYAHEHGVIHQDVKPSNFLVRLHASGQLLPDLLLADFGIARMGTSATITTISAGPRGTPRYMPPEQWEGKPVPASDQYALAVMAYQLLTLRFPFMGDQMIQLMYQHLQNQPPPPSQWNPEIKPAVDAVILRALAKKPEARFPSVKDFARALRQASQSTQPKQPTRDNDLSIFESMPTEGASYHFTTPTLPSRDRPTPTPQPARNYPPSPPQPQAPLRLPANSTFATPTASTHFEPPAQGGYAPARPAGVPMQQPAMRPAYTPVPPHPSGGAQFPSPQNTPQRASSRGRTILVLSLILLIVLASAGSAYYFLIFKGSNPPTVTRTPAVDPKTNPYTATMPTLNFADPLSRPSMWQSLPNDQLTHGFCLFQEGAYHASSNVTSAYTLCPAAPQQPVTTAMTFEVHMKILHGDCGGILFRGDFKQGNFYYFDVCFDGHHYLTIYSQFSLLRALPAQSSVLPALQANAQASVTLGIVAQGSSLTFFLNGQQVDQTTDATYSSGQIALLCFAINNPTEIIFSNARLWTA